MPRVELIAFKRFEENLTANILKKLVIKTKKCAIDCWLKGRKCFDYWLMKYNHSGPHNWNPLWLGEEKSIWVWNG